MNLLSALLLVPLLFLGGNELVRGEIGKTTAPRSTKDIIGSTTMTRQEMIAQTRPAVVDINVSCEGSETVASGSGVIIDPQGYIVTNYHMVAGMNVYDVTLFDDSSLPAQLIGVDPSDDLAVLKINTSKHLHAMPIGDSSQLHVGDDVLVIGNSKGLSQTVTSGIISALGRTPEENENEIIDAIQHDVPVNPGTSGGALVNMRTQLIGIHISPTLY